MWVANNHSEGKANDFSAVLKCLADYCASIWLTEAGSNDKEYKLFPKFPILIFLGCSKLVSLMLFKKLSID